MRRPYEDGFSLLETLGITILLVPFGLILIALCDFYWARQIFSSSMQRAMDTAQISASSFHIQEQDQRTDFNREGLMATFTQITWKHQAAIGQALKLEPSSVALALGCGYLMLEERSGAIDTTTENFGDRSQAIATTGPFTLFRGQFTAKLTSLQVKAANDTGMIRVPSALQGTRVQINYGPNQVLNAGRMGVVRGEEWRSRWATGGFQRIGVVCLSQGQVDLSARYREILAYVKLSPILNWERNFVPRVDL